MWIIRLYNLFTIILFPIALLTGCVNFKAIEAFSNGAQALSEASGTFYAMALETDRQFAGMSVDLEMKGNNNRTPWDRATTGENLISEARRNRAAVAALAQYAHSLHAITTFRDDHHLEYASQELVGNLNALSGNLKIEAAPEEAVLAHAISGLATLYLDIRVRKNIYPIITLANDHVATIVKTIRNDIQQQQQRFTIARLQATATREEWFNALRKGYHRDGISVSDQAFLTIAAGTLVEDELHDQLAVQPTMLFLKKLDKTATSCLQAHEAIQNPNLSDEADTVLTFVRDAHSLLSSLKQLNH